MLLAAAALITLHCTAAVRDNTNLGMVMFSATVDYERRYAYVADVGNMTATVYQDKFESTELDVTPTSIRFPRQDLGVAVLDRASIDRTSGRLHMLFRSPLFIDADGYRSGLRVLDGTCVPGPLVQPPTPAF
ncbi:MULTISPECIES: hypothetical protein [unclassified Brevundimonas]|uniref:hypothetical protein n=1 Tax=unclassified Brevundimonas TaxID=2622653 RepID=UPI0025BE75DC|nr:MULTISPECIES: hypothetical protein [unclassified Brevundimonas]